MHTNTGPITTDMLKPFEASKYTSLLEGILREKECAMPRPYGFSIGLMLSIFMWTYAFPKLIRRAEYEESQGNKNSKRKFDAKKKIEKIDAKSRNLKL